MRILIATGIYPPSIGGPATYSKLLFDELSGYGVEPVVLSFDEVRKLPKIIRHISYFFKVLRMGRNAEIIYAQDPVSVGFPAVLAARILGKKFIMKVVGDYAWEQFQLKDGQDKKGFVGLEEFQKYKYDFVTESRRFIEKWVACRADKIIVPSFYLRNIISGWGVNTKKIHVIYNAFQEPPFLKESKWQARETLGLSGHIILSVGRLVPWKGFAALIELLPKLIKKIPDAKLLIAGSGPDEKKLTELAEFLHVKNNVFFLGKVPHEKLLHYYRAADVFVLNTAYEGFSHQVLEALSLGTPVVTTRVGGNLEIIEHNYNGVLTEYNDAEHMTNAILEMFSNVKKAAYISFNGRRTVERFGTDKMLKSLVFEFKNTAHV
ncbi:glycosyltransferase family 4 protein [Candidatus Parcubacteria bacterium]|nr:glycosyltransferase family 4 protein [Candidatus Parcubacteria bacterium]